ncbi:MAG: porin [Magnetovibrio sp.]|nr:porin [Magnetovibrio sp.]
MKKILLGTTAVIALGTLSTEAFAADKIQLGLGGFMRQYVAISNSDEVATTTNAARDTGIGQWGNSEVYFSGSTTLDNGLKVSAKVELEANQSTTASDSIDRSFLTISSDEMGALSMGAMPHASDGLAVRVPNAGNFDWGDTDFFAGSATAATAATAAHTIVAGDITGWGDDEIKAKYISPTFNGLSIGVSWGAINTGDTEDARLVTSGSTESYTGGIAYSSNFDGIGVDASVNYGSVATNATQTHIGLSVSTNGFTLGGGYMDINDDRTSPTTSLDGESWELGVGYVTGPYSFSAAYMTASEKATATAGDDEDTKWNLAATYDMGAGVALTANYFKSEADQEGTTAATDVSGLIAGVEVSF